MISQDYAFFYDIISLLADRFFIFLLCLTRIGSFVNFFPLTGGQVMSGLWVTRTLFSAGLALFIYPVVSNQMAGATVGLSPTYGILLLKEIFLGYIVAYLFSPILWIADGLGGFIDGQRGTGQENAQDPFTDEQTTPLGLGLIETTVMLLIVSGGLLIFLGFILDSFVFWPPMSFFPDFTRSPMADLFISRLIVTVEMVLVLASPVVIATFLTDWTLGLLNRFAQQLNVYVLASSIKSAVALSILCIYGGVMFAAISKSIHNIPVFMKEVIEVFGKGILLW